MELRNFWIWPGINKSGLNYSSHLMQNIGVNFAIISFNDFNIGVK
jgi:hypothetical protein